MECSFGCGNSVVINRKRCLEEEEGENWTKKLKEDEVCGNTDHSSNNSSSNSSSEEEEEAFSFGESTSVLNTSSGNSISCNGNKKQAIASDYYLDDDEEEEEEEEAYCEYNSSKKRTLTIEYWSRTEECKERKWDHMEKMDDSNVSREEHILNTTLKGRYILLERNMFPYNTPHGIEHHTLWCKDELSTESIEDYVCNWMEKDAPYAYECWNYDDNPQRSIDIFHVHVYLKRALC